MSAASFAISANLARPAGAMFLRSEDTDSGEARLVGGLHVRVLRTARERQAITALRRHAAFDTENDLQLGLEPFEQKRDEIGYVFAVYRGGRVVASVRAVPSGHGLTAAERLLPRVPFDASVLGRGSWEIGRMVMEQEDRNPAMLMECLALCLEELLEIAEVRHLHATTSCAAMARLWRRVGFRTFVTGTGVSGKRYAFVHAHVHAAMAALSVPHYVNDPSTALPTGAMA